MDKRKKAKELEERTKDFALRVIKFVSGLPKNRVSDVIGYQLLKAGTSIGANYREANRAESRKDFIHKIGIIEKEAAETQYWLEICNDINLGNPNERAWLLREVEELIAIFSKVGKTSKLQRTQNPKS